MLYSKIVTIRDAQIQEKRYVQQEKEEGAAARHDDGDRASQGVEDVRRTREETGYGSASGSHGDYRADQGPSGAAHEGRGAPRPREVLRLEADRGSQGRGGRAEQGEALCCKALDG